MRFFLIFFLFFNFSFAKEEIFFRYFITQKSAKEVFYFLEKLNLKKILPEDWGYKKEIKGYMIKYFDTKDLKLLKKGSFCSLMIFKKNKRKVVFDNTFFETKIYRKQKSLKDKHPLFGIIKRSQRELFKDKLKKLSIKDPLMLKNIFNLTKLEWRIVILKDNQNIATLTLQRSVFKDFPVKNSYFQLFLKKREKELNREDLESLKEISFEIQKEILKKLKDIKKLDCKNGYMCDFNYFNKNPFFKLAIKSPLLYYLFYLFIVGFGFIVFFWIIKIKKR